MTLSSPFSTLQFPTPNTCSSRHLTVNFSYHLENLQNLRQAGVVNAVDQHLILTTYLPLDTTLSIFIIMDIKTKHTANKSVLDAKSPTGANKHTNRAKYCFDDDANSSSDDPADVHANGHFPGQTTDHIKDHRNGHGNFDPPKVSPEPIAVCGLAMRLPGGIRNAESFWDVLYHGKDMRGPIPADRYNAQGFDDTMGKKGAIKTKYGYFLNDDLSCLDTSFFTMVETELKKTDPQQRQILEVTRECLESAGEVDYRGKLIGCYVGTFGEDWFLLQSKEKKRHGGYSLNGDLMIANRVSYEYDFKGPSMVIKTGCSASLVGLHEACRALQSRDCNAAIVAGTSLIMGPFTTAAMTEEGILSPEGSCKSFNAAADGFARGEAINAVYIKRLDDAIKDGNPIRAVIRNTGTNSDGRSQGLMAPNGKSHEALMRKIYLDAGLNPRDTAFVEVLFSTLEPHSFNAVSNIYHPGPCNWDKCWGPN